MAMLRWLREMICFHTDKGHAIFVTRRAEEPDIYAYDFCKRCGKTLMKYSDA